MRRQHTWQQKSSARSLLGSLKMYFFGSEGESNAKVGAVSHFQITKTRVNDRIVWGYGRFSALLNMLPL